MAYQTVRNIRLIEDYRDKILFYRLFFSHIMMSSLTTKLFWLVLLLFLPKKGKENIE